MLLPIWVTLLFVVMTDIVLRVLSLRRAGPIVKSNIFFYYFYLIGWVEIVLPLGPGAGAYLNYKTTVIVLPSQHMHSKLCPAFAASCAFTRISTMQGAMEDSSSTTGGGFSSTTDLSMSCTSHVWKLNSVQVFSVGIDLDCYVSIRLCMQKLWNIRLVHPRVCLCQALLYLWLFRQFFFFAFCS